MFLMLLMQPAGIVIRASTWVFVTSITIDVIRQPGTPSTAAPHNFALKMTTFDIRF
jgi:hypothetical protein